MFKKIIMLVVMVTTSQAWANPELEKIKRQILSEQIEGISRYISQASDSESEEMKKVQAILQEIRKGVDAFIGKNKKKCESDNSSLECQLCEQFSGLLKLDKSELLKLLQHQKKTNRAQLKQLKESHAAIKKNIERLNDQIQKVEAV